MQLSAHDISQRRERNGTTTTWLSERLLVEKLGLSEKYLRSKARPEFAATVSPAKKSKSILPDTGASWRYAKLNGTFYYDYDRLPAARREALPGKEILLGQYTESLTESRQTHLENAVKAILKTEGGNYLHHYRACSDEQATSLSKACAIVAYAVREIEKGNVESATRFLEELALAVDACGVAYVPRHWRRLKEKVDAVRNGIEVEQVIHLPRAGNAYAKKFDDAEIIAWLLYMRSLPQNYPGAFIIRKLRLMCELAEKKAPSKSWFEQELAKPLTKFLTAGRFGSGKLGDRFKGYIPVQNALHAGDCWMMDGTRANMIAYRTPEGKEEFLYWIAVYDVHSGDLLGVHFDTKEDRWGYLNALKMAVSHAGYLPYEIVVDRFPGHNTPEIETLIKRLQRLGVTVTITSKKTGKSKLERLFETIQSVFMQESEWYYGEGVQSTRTHAHRSPEYLARQKKKRTDAEWTFDAAWTEMMRVVDLYRSTALSEYSSKFSQVQQSPRQLHEASDRPHARKCETWDTIELFGLEKSVTIRNGGLIKTEIQRIEYFYRVDEYNTLAGHKTVRLCYDMEDLTTVHLFEDSDAINRAYLGTATEQRRAQLYGADADKSAITESKERIASIEKKRKAHFKALTESAEAGDEMDILLGGLADKANKSTAETAWLEERTKDWKDTKGKPRLLDNSDDDDIDESIYEVVPVTNARRQY